MADVQEKIMPLRQTKQLLGLAEKDALGCAFAVTKDKKECLLFIQKTGGGKKAAKKIKKEGGSDVDVGSLRWGRVQIKKEDPGTVAFTVNRSEAGGTIMTLNRLVKKAGYQGIVINADEALENEPDEDEDDEGVPPPPPPRPTEPMADPAALKARLTELVKLIPGVVAADPSRKDGLLDHAKKANIQLATNNLKTATVLIDELEARLKESSPPTPPPPPGSGGSATALAKSRLAFTAASKRVQADVAKLRDALASHYGDGPATAILAAFDQRTAPVLAAFDESLADKLDETANTTDPAKRQTLVAECRKLIETHKAMVDGDRFIGELDANPFVPLAIRATMGATLNALATAVH